MRNKKNNGQGKTAIFGVGAMGGALLRGWIKKKMLKPSQVTIVEPDLEKSRKLAGELKVKAQADPAKALSGADMVLLAVKPQQMSNLFGQTAKFFPRKALVVSIAAGVSTYQLEKFLPQGCPVVRVMPNTPALLGAGMAAVAGGKRASRAHVKRVMGLFSAVGRSVEVGEDKMDLVTGLSGSGPAYVFHLIEGMVEAGVRGGLSPETALELAAQTVYGAGLMALETGKSPTDLRVQVTSPGGTTEAGLKVMAELGFKKSVEAAIEAATRRGAELRKISENS